jgi:5-methyltetrahydrofolate--homocysteine methyltransferase
MNMNLTERLTKGAPVLLDGAMGTQLADKGLEMGGQGCISHPDAVAAVHKAYIDAGSEILITNTLTMNRIFIESHSVGVEVEAVNHKGASLAASATTDGHYVLGDISSTGQMLKPYGTYSEDQFRDTFREQAGFLLAGGVDGFLIETMMDLREALCALSACLEVSTMPVLVSLSFQTTNNGGRTLMGNSAQEAALALADAGATAIGANCGDLDPYETAHIIELMRAHTDLPLIAKPNAGKPLLKDGKTSYEMRPPAFTAGMAACIDAGATLVGGCCGTTPEHIRHLSESLRERAKKI